MVGDGIEIDEKCGQVKLVDTPLEIDDRVHALRQAVENESIMATAADERVMAQIAIKDVIPFLTENNVIAGTAMQDIIAAAPSGSFPSKWTSAIKSSILSALVIAPGCNESEQT